MYSPATGTRTRRWARRQRNRAQARAYLAQTGNPTPTSVAPLLARVALAGAELADKPSTPSLFDAAAQADRESARDRGLASLKTTEGLLRELLVVSPVIDPGFHAALLDAEAVEIGERSYRLPLDERKINTRPLDRLLDIVPAAILYGPRSWGAQQSAQGRSRELWAMLHRYGPTMRVGEHPQHGPLSTMGVVVSVHRDHGCFVKVCTRPSGPVGNGHPLHRFPHHESLNATALTPDEALQAVHDARELGWKVEDPDNLIALVDPVVRVAVILRTVVGMPGLARVIEGQAEGAPASRRTVNVEHAARIAKDAEADGRTVVMDDRVADGARMASAPPSLDPILIGPQAIAVARHLATEYGYANCASTGTGKSVMAARAMRAKALKLPAYRALVVTKKALRSQWAIEELRDKFPESPVLIPDARELSERLNHSDLGLWLGETRGIARSIADADRRTGEQPLVVVCHYEQVRSSADAFRVIDWDDLIVDEGARLANPNTQLSRALRRVRERCAVAVVLTATPMNKTLADLDAIVAFVRDDAEHAKAGGVSHRYMQVDGTSMRRLARALGPVLFRVSAQEFSEHMPGVRVEHQALDQTPAEARLSDAVENRLADLLSDVLAAKEQRASIDPNDPVVAEIDRLMASRQGLLQGAGSVARLAACDPEAVVGSSSATAALVGGLIEPAVRSGPTKRQVVAETVAACAADEHRILIFGEQASALSLLARELRDEHEIEAGLYTGESTPAQRESLKTRYQAGELPVLLVSEVGMEGLNLHETTTVIVHYDLPFVPSQLQQRTGRAVRIGAGGRTVQVLVPYMRHSIEERVAAKLIPRAAHAHAALDGARGEDLEPTGAGALLSGLADELKASGGSILLEIAAEILAARGGR